MTISQNFKQAGAQMLRHATRGAALLFGALALSACSSLKVSNILVCNNDYSRCTLALGVPTDSPAAKILAPDGAVTTVDPKTGAMVTTRNAAFYRSHSDCIIGSGDNNPGCYSREPPPRVSDRYQTSPVKLSFSNGFEPVEFKVGQQNVLTSTDGASYRLPEANDGARTFNLNLQQAYNCPKGTTLVFLTDALERGNDPTRSTACATLPPPASLSRPSVSTTAPR